MSAYRKFREFHGKPARRTSLLDIHVPKRLVLLGEAVAIEYRCDKLNGGGDGTKAVYRHEFDTPAILCMDERGRKQLYIIGPRLAVNDRGIIN
jgi:hypothetical protein